MYINGKWYTEPQLQAYVQKLESKVSELEDKHHNECGQIAHYSDELAEAKELLKLAVQDLASALHYVSKFTSGALIEDTNVPAREDGAENG